MANEVPSTEGAIDDYLGGLEGDQLFEAPVQEEKKLFQAPKTSILAPALAANRAHQDAIVNQDSESFPSRMQEHLYGNVQDATVARVQDLITEQGVMDLGALDPEVMKNKTQEERFATIVRQVDRISLVNDSVLPRDIALIEYYRAGNADGTMSEFEHFHRQVDVSDLSARAQWRTTKARQEARREIDDIAAANSWSSYGEMFKEVGMQDFIPVMGLATRIGLDRKIFETVTGRPANGWEGFFLGEIRQKIRAELIQQPPAEFRKTTAAIKQMVEELQRDPVLAPMLTKYNLIESLEAIFTDEAFDGTSAKNSGDRFFGNLETLLEGVFSVVTIFKVGGTIRGAGRAMNKLKASNLAAASGTPEVAGRLADEFQVDSLSVQFGLEADEAVTAVLPKPHAFADDIDELPEGSKNLVLRNDRIRSEIMETTAQSELGLTRADRTNVVQSEIDALDLADGAAVQPRMSTLQKFEDGSGFRMRVVVGDSAEGGYKDIKDAMLDAIEIDPDLANMNIMRVGPNGTLEPVFDTAEDFQNALFRGQTDATTAGRIAGGDTLDESFYLAHDVDRFYHSVDKELFSPEALTAQGLVPRALLSPNAKFGDEIYGSFLRAYMGEEQLSANFELMFKPYYALGRKDKRFVNAAFEWMEDFGKNNRRAPTINETLTQYDGVTNAQLDGMIALRDGMDTMHELFNRRLYRNWKGAGFQTARPMDNTLPTFHGRKLDVSEASGQHALDPVTGKMVRISRKEADDMYNTGTSIMELDVAVDAANDAGHSATRVIMRRESYDVGELSTKPLIYHPGYSIRFYDDPFYVVKSSVGKALNGTVRATDRGVEEAIRTAGTKAEAERFAARANRASERRGWGSTFSVTRGNDISKTESSLFQKQTIHREGRLFWDSRNADRLPDVNGNRARLEDPVKALERGIGLASRQLTHEDLLKSVKNTWKNQYGAALVRNGSLTEQELKVFDLKAVSEKLGKLRADEVSSAAKKNLKDAKEMLDYFRLIEGTDGVIVPAMREAAIGVAQMLDGVTSRGVQRSLQKSAQVFDPFRFMRSVAFNAFMVFRPVRQLILQAAQIGFLAPLKPLYVGSGQIFTDGRMLRRGMMALRKSGYQDGLTDKTAAKAMGLSPKEYRKVVKEFNRSGLVDLVDVHSFAGGAKKFQKVQLGQEGLVGATGYKAKQLGKGIQGWFQKVGFNRGEGFNLAFTYNLALKRLMDKKGYQSLLEIKPREWQTLRTDASDLALGMARPNNFGYQTGALGVATQFLSFSHKSALALLGKNPAIKGGDHLKIVLGSYLLYGANMYGSRDWAEERLVELGVENASVPGMEGSTLVDLLSGGVIDTTFNALADMTIKDHKDLELGFLAPGLDVARIWENQITSIWEQPAKVIFGPFGNVFSGVAQSLDFANRMTAASPDIEPADKFTAVANMVLSGAFPQYNDANKAYMGYQMNQWYSGSLEAMPLRPTMTALLARTAFGGRTREELGYYRAQNKIWEDKANYNDIVDSHKKFLQQQITLFSSGTLSYEQFTRNQEYLMNVYEEWPEGQRRQLLKDIMITQQDDPTIPTMERRLVEAFQNKQVRGEEVVLLIDRFIDIPEAKREKLKQLVKESYASKKIADDKAFEDNKGQE